MTQTATRPNLLAKLSRAVKRWRSIAQMEIQLRDAFARINVLEQSLAAVQRQAAGVEQVTTRLCSQPQPMPWQQTRTYEASVNLACQDLCRPGAICFDVGSHTGALSMILSRLSGPRGVVVAFEANAHNVRLAQANLAFNNCHNVFTVNHCVWQRSGERLTFHLPEGDGESQVGSLYHGQGRTATTVTSVALDDFVAATGLMPALVKMDIEGAEHDALLGMQRAIEKARPHLILEQAIEDGDKCFELLRQLGYVGIDLHNYRFVQGCADFPAKAVVRNVLFIHRERIDETPYSLNMRMGPTQTSPGPIAARSVPPRRFQTWAAQLGKGRYAFSADIQTEDATSPFELRARVGGDVRVYYGGSPKWLADSYSEFILDLVEPALIEVETCDLTSSATAQLAGVSYAPVLGHKGAPGSLFC